MINLNQLEALKSWRNRYMLLYVHWTGQYHDRPTYKVKFKKAYYACICQLFVAEIHAMILMEMMGSHITAKTFLSHARSTNQVV